MCKHIAWTKISQQSGRSAEIRQSCGLKPSEVCWPNECILGEDLPILDETKLDFLYVVPHSAPFTNKTKVASPVDFCTKRVFLRRWRHLGCVRMFFDHVPLSVVQAPRTRSYVRGSSLRTSCGGDLTCDISLLTDDTT